MDSERKQLANPFSTGGGGTDFENQVQSAFVVLMLTRGTAPCVAPAPITTIKLQGKYEGYDTDDFIIFVDDVAGRKAKLLGQIKHGATITGGDVAFTAAISAAWRDFKNPKLFNHETDAITLVTGPMSGTDLEAGDVLDLARHSASADEFLKKVGLGKFYSDVKRAKLKAFREQLKKANKDVDLSDDEFWRFLKCYYILTYDLDAKSGVALSLLYSHLSQFECGEIAATWAEISREVAAFNKNAGTITRKTLSRSLREKFDQTKVHVETPEGLGAGLAPNNDALLGDRGDAVTIASLLGAWDDKNSGDMDAARRLIE
jgi:hypothetical protein